MAEEPQFVSSVGEKEKSIKKKEGSKVFLGFIPIILAPLILIVGWLGVPIGFVFIIALLFPFIAVITFLYGLSQAKNLKLSKKDKRLAVIGLILSIIEAMFFLFLLMFGKCC